MPTIVHVTHEAVRQSGGIGTVLRGLIVAPSYAARVERTLLLGPLSDPDSPEPLGADGQVIYDSGRGIADADVSAALDPVAAWFGVRLVYGKRRLRGEQGEAFPEVLLVDVSRPPQGLDSFKYYLGEHFGLDSQRYESAPEYEQYLRLAEPGFEGMRALLGDAAGPVWVIAHEFMGMATVFKTLLSGDRRCRTAFYAHEVATVRRLVEELPGRDIQFYNLLRRARQTGGYMGDFFGSQDWYFKHALISQAWRCDVILAVGDWVVEELRFLGPAFANRQIDLVYNGLPAEALSFDGRRQARHKLQQYAATLLGYVPELIFTHVTRLVSSKGLWRDLLVLGQLDRLLAEQGRQAVFVALATEVGGRAPEVVQRMVDEYGWPLVHREGFPDLTPAEVDFDLQVRAFNARARAVKILFVNQFGWDQASCGTTMPAGMEFMDLRRGSDVEFGQSIYEPFGIALLEPLGCGALCVIGDVCGCLGFVARCAGQEAPAGVVRAEYTRLPDELENRAIEELDRQTCAYLEANESRRVAQVLAERLPENEAQARQLLDQGQAIAARMRWERVAEAYFLPVLARW